MHHCVPEEVRGWCVRVEEAELVEDVLEAVGVDDWEEVAMGMGMFRAAWTLVAAARYSMGWTTVWRVNSCTTA